MTMRENIKAEVANREEYESKIKAMIRRCQSLERYVEGQVPKPVAEPVVAGTGKWSMVVS